MVTIGLRLVQSEPLRAFARARSDESNQCLQDTHATRTHTHANTRKDVNARTVTAAKESANLQGFFSCLAING